MVKLFQNRMSVGTKTNHIFLRKGKYTIYREIKDLGWLVFVGLYGNSGRPVLISLIRYEDGIKI